MVVGVLALQGDFAAHGKKLQELGQPWRLIKQPEDLGAVDALIIPGGESSALLKLMAPMKMLEALEYFGRSSDKPIFGTCAGMILLAKNVIPQQKSLGLIDITVERNAYGRQLDSFIASGQIVSEKLLNWDVFPENTITCKQNCYINQHTISKNPNINQNPEEIELVFIRAPKIRSIDSKDVEILVTFQDQPMLVQQKNILVSSFHPELTEDNRVYEYFCNL